MSDTDFGDAPMPGCAFRPPSRIQRVTALLLGCFFNLLVVMTPWRWLSDRRAARARFAIWVYANAWGYAERWMGRL